jgi:hypothetical protein
MAVTKEVSIIDARAVAPKIKDRDRYTPPRLGSMLLRIPGSDQELFFQPSIALNLVRRSTTVEWNLHSTSSDDSPVLLKTVAPPGLHSITVTMSFPGSAVNVIEMQRTQRLGTEHIISITDPLKGTMVYRMDGGTFGEGGPDAPQLINQDGFVVARLEKHGRTFDEKGVMQFMDTFSEENELLITACALTFRWKFGSSFSSNWVWKVLFCTLACSV